MAELDRIAAAVRALEPSCGPVRLVAVDGHAGSGKSTFTGRLAAALGGAPVVHLDDLATHEEFFAWTARLRAQVLEPFARGEAGRLTAYDWHLRRFGPGARAVGPAPVVLIEGVGAGRREVRPWLALLLWMDMDAAGSWARGRRRDGTALSGFWDEWTAAETRHFTEDPSRPYADALVRQCHEGYEWLPRRDSPPLAHHLVTEGDHIPPVG
ncbi:uridine kinase [Streptomyces sp. NPDC059070]|uniref:uridine kinase family protein n=1 Tax=unclassified Streptomyces TaxID=2593676 RepID=UPI0034E1B877